MSTHKTAVICIVFGLVSIHLGSLLGAVFCISFASTLVHVVKVSATPASEVSVDLEAKLAVSVVMLAGSILIIAGLSIKTVLQL